MEGCSMVLSIQLEPMQDQGPGFGCKSPSILGALSGATEAPGDGSGGGVDLGPMGDTSTTRLQWTRPPATQGRLPTECSRCWIPDPRETRGFCSLSKCKGHLPFARPAADCLSMGSRIGCFER